MPESDGSGLRGGVRDMNRPIGPFTQGWVITSEPLRSSTMKRLQGYACFRVDVKLQGCTPGAVYTAGLNLYGVDEPNFCGIERLAYEPGTRTIDGASREQVNGYALVTRKANKDGYVKFRRILPATPGTYDVQLWVAKGELSARGGPPRVCYKSGKAFGDSQEVTILGDSTDFHTLLHPHRMSLPPLRSSIIANRLLLRGIWEPLTTELATDVIKEGDVVLDLGAHIGYHTLIFAKLVGPSGQVFAFEPDPINFALLEKNVRLNRYTNVTLVPKAVSDAPGIVPLFLGGTQNEDHSITGGRSDRDAIDVQAVRLDDYFHGFDGTVDFIKMDIEGSEPAALAGMTELLRQSATVKLVTEFFPGSLQRSGFEPIDYLRLLRGHGFKLVYHLNERDGRREPVEIARVLRAFAPETDLATNLFCVKEPYADRAFELQPTVAHEEAASHALETNDVAKALSGPAPLPVRRLPGDLRDFEAKVSSQNGEDGIIHEICARIGLTRGVFVEFGAESGSECNCARLVGEEEWTGFFIEGDAKRVQRLVATYRGYRDVTCAQAWVTPSNVESLFARIGVPRNFDLLSIDIDGNDYWVWKAITSYRPTVVVIEYNASYPPPIRWVMAQNDRHVWDETSYFGASLSSLAVLGEQKGYRLIGTTSNGVNAFFLRSDYFDRSAFLAESVEYHYSPPSYGPCYGGHPRRLGPHLTV